MKQCENCMMKDHKDELCGCAAAHLGHAFRELLKGIPLLGKHIQEYECQNWLEDDGK